MNIMAQVAYPIAPSAHDALALLKGGKAKRAVREREAEALCGARVCFVTENIGPLYERQADALDACKGLVEDEWPGHIFLPAPEDQICRLVCRLKDAPKRGRKPVQPVFQDGERWPKTVKPMESVWQLSISYWKVLDEARKPVAARSSKPARALRRKGGEALTPEEVLGLAESPLVAARPQKALDFGLFDFAPAENPGIIIADE